MPHSPYRLLHCTSPFSPLDKKMPLAVTGSVPTSDTWLTLPNRPTTPNSISIESAVFLQYTFVNNGQTDRLTNHRWNEHGTRSAMRWFYVHTEKKVVEKYFLV